MARERLTRNQISAWRFFYFPVIIGLVIGASAASATDQWWWAAVGAAVGPRSAKRYAGRSSAVLPITAADLLINQRQFHR